MPSHAEQRSKRIESIYEEDRGKQSRKSHENPSIQTLYASFLTEPLSEMSHHLLHTHYTKRSAWDY